MIILSALVSVSYNKIKTKKLKFDDPETSAYVLSTELVPLSLSFLESDRLLCTLVYLQSLKTYFIKVAAKTIENLLNDDVGLQYICNTYDRFARIVISLVYFIDYLIIKLRVKLLID